MLHEEVSRLPERYRMPIVLCYFEGLSHDQAAARLGWPVGTVKGRLSRARELLRGRLSRRGVTVTSAAIAAQLAITSARASVPASLAHSTLKAALAVAEGAAASLTASSAVSLHSAALTEGVLQTMFVSQMKLVAIPILVAAGILTTSATLIAYQFQPQPKPKQGGSSRPSHPPPKLPHVAKPADESLQAEIRTAVQTLDNLRRIVDQRHGRPGHRPVPVLQLVAQSPRRPSGSPPATTRAATRLSSAHRGRLASLIQELKASSHADKLPQVRAASARSLPQESRPIARAKSPPGDDGVHGGMPAALVVAGWEAASGGGRGRRRHRSRSRRIRRRRRRRTKRRSGYRMMIAGTARPGGRRREKPQEPGDPQATR